MTKPITRPRLPAGRKPLAPGGLTRLSVRLSAAQLVYLATVDPSPSVALRVVVDKAIRHEQQHDTP